jgi:hypothetical protein
MYVGMPVGMSVGRQICRLGRYVSMYVGRPVGMSVGQYIVGT